MPACKPCMKRNRCKRPCDDQQCKCRQLCEGCAADIRAAVRRVWGVARLKQGVLL